MKNRWPLWSFFATNDQGRRNIEWHNFHVHISKNTFVKRQHQGNVVKLHKPAARLEPAQAFGSDAFRQRFGQHDKWNTGNEIVDGLDPSLFKIPSHVFCRIMNDRDAWVVLEGLVQFFDKYLVDFKNQKLRIRLQAVQDIVRYHPVARA